MKIATWNINSVRAREARLVAWLAKAQPDVLCLQETKTEDAGFPTEVLKRAGYDVVLFGQKSYNGVAIASKLPITDVARGFGDDRPDDEARVIAATIAGIRVIDVYVPNGQDIGTEKYAYKMAWYRRLRAYLDRTATPATPLVLCGDFNVTRDDKDVWSPEAWAGKIHCSPDERAALGRRARLRARRSVSPAPTRRRRVLVVGLPRRQLLHEPGAAHRLRVRDRAGRRADRAVTIDRDARKGQDASDHAPVIMTTINLRIAFGPSCSLSATSAPDGRRGTAEPSMDRPDPVDLLRVRRARRARAVAITLVGGAMRRVSSAIRDDPAMDGRRGRHERR